MKYCKKRHFSLIAAIEFFKIVLVLSETVLVLVLDRTDLRVRVPPVAEYEYENDGDQREVSKKRFYLLALLAVVFSNGCAKSVAHERSVSVMDSHRKLTKTQGSTNYDQIRCGLQDKAGALWFGSTGEGVYRYDNQTFTQYSVQDGLSSNTVWCILEDKKGSIWFGTDAGLSRWDGKRIRPVPFSLTSSEQPVVWSMLQDKSGSIWIGTSDGMSCCKDEAITPFFGILGSSKVRNEEGLHLKMVDDIFEDRHGNLWFASGMPPGMEGLGRYDGSSLTSFKPGGEKWIRSVIEDRDGILWLGTRHKGVWRYDGKSFSQFTEQPGLGMPLLMDRLGNIWFSGEEHANGFEGMAGIFRYDGKTYQNFFTKEGLGNFGVWCIIEDRDGNIWVGTRNMGLYRYDGKSIVSLSD